MHPARALYQTLPLVQRILIIPGIAFAALLILMLLRGEFISLIFLLPALIAIGFSANLGRDTRRTAAWTLTLYGIAGIILIPLSLISFP